MSCAFHGDNRMQLHSPDPFSLFALGGAGLRDYVKYRYCCSDHTSLQPHLLFVYVMQNLIKRVRERCVPYQALSSSSLLEPGYEATLP